MPFNLKRNKYRYKLLFTLIILFVLADIFTHKGLLRFLIPKKFTACNTKTITPLQVNQIINKNKNWEKAVNTPARMNAVPADAAGLEFDIYYDSLKNIFDVHHDANASVGQNFEDLLIARQSKKLDAAVWIDFKNVNQNNLKNSITLLKTLREKYNLYNKIIVESSYPDLLQLFTKDQFYTSYYVPYFNPYISNDAENKKCCDSISVTISKYPVNALSGYYFQMPFLHQHFPLFPILSWAPNDKWSLINWLYKKKVNADSSAFISLYN